MKQAIHMSKGGRAWRGFFPTGEELTSGRPDMKEASGDLVRGPMRVDTNMDTEVWTST